MVSNLVGHGAETAFDADLTLAALHAHSLRDALSARLAQQGLGCKTSGVRLGVVLYGDELYQELDKEVAATRSAAATIDVVVGLVVLVALVSAIVLVVRRRRKEQRERLAAALQ